MPSRRLVARLLQPYWRLTRGQTLGAQGLVIDADDRIVLIRHTYRPGWHFPGGGVEWNETVETALRRELLEEAGVVVGGPPQLFGLYANFAIFPRDHVALFVVRDWRRDGLPRPSAEIAEHGLFAADKLPDTIAAGARRRIGEVMAGAPRSEHW
jgi:ADP-ribose pyrophosphatase YjhB (NUDIX family)